MVNIWKLIYMEFYDFPFLGNFIIPTDELTPSFFRGVAQPPVWMVFKKFSTQFRIALSFSGNV
jgi:hypothetical protein